MLNSHVGTEVQIKQSINSVLLHQEMQYESLFFTVKAISQFCAVQAIAHLINSQRQWKCVLGSDKSILQLVSEKKGVLCPEDKRYHPACEWKQMLMSVSMGQQQNKRHG